MHPMFSSAQLPYMLAKRVQADDTVEHAGEQVQRRYFIQLDTPLVWSGDHHLLLEFSMDNNQTAVDDTTRVNFKYAMMPLPLFQRNTAHS